MSVFGDRDECDAVGTVRRSRRRGQGERHQIAARNALLNMIGYLGELGWSRQHAYPICSVAVDLKVSQLVDVPSFLVSAFLPEHIFTV